MNKLFYVLIDCAVCTDTYTLELDPELFVNEQNFWAMTWTSCLWCISRSWMVVEHQVSYPRRSEHQTVGQNQTGITCCCQVITVHWAMDWPVYWACNLLRLWAHLPAHHLSHRSIAVQYFSVVFPWLCSLCTCSMRCVLLLLCILAYCGLNTWLLSAVSVLTHDK